MFKSLNIERDVGGILKLFICRFIDDFWMMKSVYNWLYMVENIVLVIIMGIICKIILICSRIDECMIINVRGEGYNNLEIWRILRYLCKIFLKLNYFFNLGNGVKFLGVYMVFIDFVFLYFYGCFVKKFGICDENWEIEECVINIKK